ncbi:BACON domain-containing protein [Alistipes sp.]|uniref:BACON domain-containing protein n=1 Tax=Alistipes sp. TaxID=1872444 RepID=UPI003AF0C553
MNKLQVTPSGDITFKADANQDVVLTVVTDAAKWSVEKTDWITVKQDGNKLTVNAEANTDESPRPGRITISAGTAEPVKINVLQEAAEVGETVLTVTPSEALAFEAKDNQPVVLTVTTNASSWTFTYPEEWMTASKEGDKLTVNAKDNTGEAHMGQIVVTAEQKTVKIAVTQKAASTDPDPVEKIAGGLKTADALAHMFPYKEPEAVKKTLMFELEKAAEAETQVKVQLDEAYIAEYNYLNGTKFIAFPQANVTIANNGIVTIAAGATSGSIEVTLAPSAGLSITDAYMVPLLAVAQTANVSVKTDAARVNFTVKQQGSKTVRNFLYFEVNDTNPLNALEYVLEDGQLFFDAVVLFSGNIHWDTQSGKPYMHYNDNVTALLADKELYIQPLRDRGIKVLMGVLGDHDGSGPANLTEKGAEVFAEHLAEMCVEYGLDGICMDDEYSEYNKAPNNEYFSGSSRSLQQATYLLERTNYYMKKDVPWDTMIAVFYWGIYGSGMPSINGRQPAEFVDMVNANYGGSASPVAGGDLSMCSFQSVECNLGGGSVSEASARSAKERGYGWCMWFALDPVLGREPWSKLSAAAKGLYDQDLKPRTGYYKKTGAGRYDPKRYEE